MIKLKLDREMWQFVKNKKRGLNLDIGGIGLTLSFPSPSFLKSVRSYYHPFINDRVGEYSILIEVDKERYKRELINLGLEELPPDMPPQLLKRDNETLVHLQGAFAIIGEDGDVGYALFKDINPTALDSLMRILFSRLSLRHKGLLIHSAGVRMGGRGALFIGPSESGKSTIAKLTPPSYTVLTDELSLVVKKNGDFWVFGTPFAGFSRRFRANFGVPLGALFLNQKDELNYLEPASLPFSLREVVSNSLLFETDSTRIEEFMGTAEELILSVPCYKLHFKPTRELWKVIADDKAR